MKTDLTKPLSSPSTAREFLVYLMGETHELHSVAHHHVSKTSLVVVCSCKETVTVPNEDRFVKALRNSPKDRKV